ncbi:MAG TPA: 3-methyl-2-oxobutanoate hydroxymethyltransferase [Candidatus Omnitrophota bacterium]|nr:3-methyl-2-oxobutanoate hydroxymethyltransferase [Candidatus Omnitrophota bacterium]HPS19950.1 3-methyl-2-oxobutanoate hydroxymethyltransferase [Candidatus Omnitrophota bacterium]
MNKDKFTVLDFRKKKETGSKITMLTAYDYSMAKLIDASGVDAILVGDSLGMVVLGYDSTVPVTMEDMIHHTKAVRRGTERAFLIGDMPFMSYQASDEEAIRNAGRFVKDAGCDAVKIEWCEHAPGRAQAIYRSGISVIGHVGLTPQTIGQLGGYKVQGKDAESASHLLDSALALEKAGCFAIILECVPVELSKKITARLKIPTIGIGAGSDCDGQVLVTYDIVGYFDKFVPKFVKQYTNVNSAITEALRSFKKEVETGAFPDDAHSFHSGK